MSFDVQMSPALARALISWEDRLYEIWCVIRQSQHMIPVLKEARMHSCSKSAARIYSDLQHQAMTGELFMRMGRQHAVEHTVLNESVGAEVFRQFTASALPYYFWVSDEDPRRDELDGLLEEFRQAARAAIKEEADGQVPGGEVEGPVHAVQPVRAEDDGPAEPGGEEAQAAPTDPRVINWSDQRTGANG